MSDNVDLYLLLDDLDKINEGQVSNVCWFCERAAAEGGCEAEVEMHRPVKEFNKSGKAEIVRYETLATYLRRCSGCEVAHKRVEGYVGYGWMAGAVVGCLASIATVYALWPLEIKEILGIFGIEIVVACLIGGLAFWFIGRRSAPKDVKDQRNREHHPDLRRLKEAGWIVGGKPLVINQ